MPDQERAGERRTAEMAREKLGHDRVGASFTASARYGHCQPLAATEHPAHSADEMACVGAARDCSESAGETCRPARSGDGRLQASDRSRADNMLETHCTPHLTDAFSVGVL